MVHCVGVLPPTTVYVHVGRDRSKDRISSGISCEFQDGGFFPWQHVNIPHLTALAFHFADRHASVCVLADLLRLRRQFMVAQPSGMGKVKNIRVVLFGKAIVAGSFIPASLNIFSPPLGKLNGKIPRCAAVELARCRPLGRQSYRRTVHD